MLWNEEETDDTTRIRVEGTSCENCAGKIQLALLAVPRVLRAEVSHSKKEAVVEGTACLDDLLNAVKASGFVALPWSEEREATTVKLRVEGTSCQRSCATKVRNALLSVQGVTSAEVSHERKEAVVEGTSDLDDLLNAVKASGFVALPWSEEIEATTVKLRVEGTSCQRSCATKVRNALLSVQGVTSAEVSHERKEAVVEGTSDLDDLLNAVKASGFVALPWKEENEKKGNYVFIPEETFDFPDLIQSNPSSPSVSTHLRRRSLGRLQLKFLIDGMSCGACVNKVQKKLQAMDRVGAVEISLLSGVANVEMSPNVPVDDIHKAISELGFSSKHLPSLVQRSDTTKEGGGLIELKVPDMTNDVTCSPTIRRRLVAMSGVSEVSFLEPYGIVRIHTLPIDPVGPRDAIDAITSLGYSAELQIEEGAKGDMLTAQENETQMWKRLFLISLGLMTPIFVSKLIGKPISPWLMAILTGVIQFYVGHRFYRAAWLSARHWNFGMDALVVTGTTLAFGYSLLILVMSTICPSVMALQGHVFFEASGMLITFISLGKYFEAKAKGKTGRALSLLMELQPHSVILVDSAPKTKKLGDGRGDRNIDIALVQPGDLLRIIPGAQVPTDGVVVEGSSFVDESMITGEPTAVCRSPGDVVVGGSVNQNGMFLMQASKVGRDTFLSQIMRLVQDAQMSKASIQDHADHLASIFTPVILSIALVTFILWYILGLMSKIPEEWMVNEGNDPFLFALLFAISTVVISCPCALGLATPTAVMVGTCVGATNGLLIKGGKALELADGVTTVLFDKTGTITTGMTVLSDEIAFLREPGDGEHETLALAACAEVGSEHPIGRCIVLAAQNLSINMVHVTDFVSSPGQGVCCQHPCGRVSVGNRSWMASQNVHIDYDGEVEKTVSGLETQGKTVVLVSLDRRIVGALAVSDKVKSESKSTVLALNRLGIDVWMVTGDNHRTAAAVAKSVDIPPNRVLAGIMPEEKAVKVKELQNAGFRVAMVGDGINDSPSLAMADVGIALGTGTQVAVEAAQIVLIRNNLHDVVVSLDLSRKVVKRIKLNFLWAFIYNLCGIPMAAGALYPVLLTRLPPAFAGLSMTLSSICVVLSSLSLNLYTKPRISEEGFIVTGDAEWQQQPDGELNSSSSSGGALGWLRQFIPKSWFRSTGRHPYRVVENKLQPPPPLLSPDSETEASSSTSQYGLLHEITPRTRLGHFV